MTAMLKGTVVRGTHPMPLAVVAGFLGDRVLRLQEECTAILKALARFGMLQLTTGNPAARMSQRGQLSGLSLIGQCGVGQVREAALSLDLFTRHWTCVLAVVAPVARFAPRTLLFFDAQGELLHQVQVVEERGGLTFEDLVCTLLHPDQLQLPCSQPPMADVEVARVDLNALEQDWSVLKDPAEFAQLLRRHGIRRLRAYRQVRDKFARAVSLDSVPSLLTLAAARQTPVKLSCSNRGVVQRYQGALPFPAWQGDALCLRQPSLQFELDMSRVASVWRVRKPSMDGILTSVELFDGQDERVLTLTSAQSHGRLERPSWKALLSDSLLPPEPGSGTLH